MVNSTCDSTPAAVFHQVWSQQLESTQAVTYLSSPTHLLTAYTFAHFLHICPIAHGHLAGHLLLHLSDHLHFAHSPAQCLITLLKGDMGIVHLVDNSLLVVMCSVGEVRSGPVPGHFCRTGDWTVRSLMKYLGGPPGTIYFGLVPVQMQSRRSSFSFYFYFFKLQCM